MHPRTLGPYRLTALLSEDPYGTLHRAVRAEGGTFGRHALLRRFDGAWMEAGLGARLGEAVSLSLKVGEQPGLAPHLRIYHGSEAFLAYDLVPGRSLAQTLAACRAQGLPFSMEHLLAVMRDLAEALAALHAKGLEGALLDPHLVWLGYDGSVLLLDAPVAPLLQELAARHSTLAARLQVPDLPLDPVQRDLGRLARLGYAMLALDPKPCAPEAMLAGLQAWREEEGDRADRWIALFRRMMGLGEPFRSLLEFQFAAGQLLQAEDHSPSTFSLAFLMQTAFRSELRQEERERASEREQAWTLSGAVPALALPQEPARTSERRRGSRLAVVALLVAAAGTGVFLTQRRNHEAAEGLRAEVAALQRREAELDQKRADLDAVAAREAEARRRLEQELKAAEDLARREALRQELERAQTREREVARQRAEAQAEQRAAQVRRAQLPAPLPAAPAPPPTRTPVADQPARALQVPALAIAGRAKARVFVSEQGRALRALVMEAPGGGEEAVKEAALRGTYQAAVQGGNPARAWVEVEFSGR